MKETESHRLRELSFSLLHTFVGTHPEHYFCVTYIFSPVYNVFTIPHNDLSVTQVF